MPTRNIFIAIVLLTSLIMGSCTAQDELKPTNVRPRNVEEDDVLVFPINVEPPTLNSYLGQTGYEAMVTQLIHESLASVGPDGAYYPVLAKYLPTIENGGVSEDGLTITWKLKEGVVWSDGSPFTSSDVKFTWESVSSPDSGAVWGPGIDLISNIETPDDLTAIITYSDYYPDYLGQFSSTPTGGQGILPKHACGDPAGMSSWQCNRHPIGTGPYILEEWQAGQHLRFKRNPLYREEGKPLIDTILFLIVPDPSVHYLMMLNGEADVWWLVDQQYIDEFQNRPGFEFNPGRNFSMRLFFNLNAPGTSDPDSEHPILSDINVRRAISLAIDPDLINEGVYKNMAKEVRNELSDGIYTCPQPTDIVFDPDLANMLLERSGWVDVDSDGIRECEGCASAEPGSKLSINFKTFSEEMSLVLTQQIIVDLLSDVGIQVVPITEESSLLDASSIDGKFDILMWIDGYELSNDPTEFLKTYYASESIPVYNIMRYRNSLVDRIFEQLQISSDASERSKLLCDLDAIITEELPVLFLLSIPSPSVMSERIMGWEPNPYAIETWDIENWSINEE